MKNKFRFIIGLATTAVMVSCYPPQPPEDIPLVDEEGTEQKLNEAGEVIEEGVDPTDVGLSEEARKELEHQRKLEAEAKARAKAKADAAKKVVEPVVKKPVTPKLPPIKPVEPEVKKPIIPEPKKPVNYPYASAVPNKAGFVFNPYTQSQVDVRGLASGTLVTDPRDKTQKFYVP